MKYIFPVLAALLFLSAAVGGYWYVHTMMRVSMDAEATARAEGAQAEEREKFARTARTFLDGIRAERTELSSYVATDADFVAIIETIEAAALRERVSVSVGSVSVQPESSKFHERVALELSATGSFANITMFASALETLPFASRVTSVALEQSLDRTWFSRITMDVLKRKP